jgi:hypothetical protein
MDPGFAHYDYQVTCVESGRQFFLNEEGTNNSKSTDFLARFYMNGKDGCKRCSSTDHHLLGAVKR